LTILLGEANLNVLTTSASAVGDLLGFIAYSHGQQIGRIAAHNGKTSANFICFGSRDQPKCIYCAKLASLDWSDSGKANLLRITWSSFQKFIGTWPS